MSDCDNKWADEFPLTGSGDTKEAAEEKFKQLLAEQLRPLREKLKCQKKSCIKETGLGGDEEAGPACLFHYALEGNGQAKEVTRTFHVFNPKTGKYQKIEDKKIWEQTQTVKYGCWCFV